MDILIFYLILSAVLVGIFYVGTKIRQVFFDPSGHSAERQAVGCLLLLIIVFFILVAFAE